MKQLDLPPYSGDKTKLVLSFDVGTAFSKVAYSILYPGEEPQIRSITRYPGNEAFNGDDKVPTILYYDKAGKVRAAGAEAILEDIEEKAEDEEWVKAEWFMEYVPSNSTSDFSDQQRSTLPDRLQRTFVDLYADFLKYLYTCAKMYIRDTHPNGSSLWESVKSNIEFILLYPNGWKSAQQQRMREAAVKAGFIADMPEEYQKIKLVAKGEASLHFCLHNWTPDKHLHDGDAVLLIDAGDNTIEITAYGTSLGQQLQELSAPDSYHQGSLHVTNRAYQWIQDYLKNSKFSEDIPIITAQFDRISMRVFSDPSNPVIIRFGTVRTNDPAYNIRTGRLKMTGEEVARFFQPSVKCIIDGTLAQKWKAQTKIAAAFMVGEFSDNAYLYHQVRNALAQLADIEVHQPDAKLSSALSHGAILWHLSTLLQSRTKADGATSASSPMPERFATSPHTINLTIQCSNISAGNDVNIYAAGRDLHVHKGDVVIVYNIITDPAILKAILSGS